MEHSFFLIFRGLQLLERGTSFVDVTAGTAGQLSAAAFGIVCKSSDSGISLGESCPNDAVRIAFILITCEW
jgi:hypothetical protein